MLYAKAAIRTCLYRRIAQGHFRLSIKRSVNYSRDRNTFPLANDIRNYLYSKNVKAVSGHTCFKCESIFPPGKSSQRTKKSDAMNMYINKTTGDFVCMDTGRSGSWQDLREFTEKASFKAVTKIPNKFTKNPEGDEEINKCWENSTPLMDLSDIIREEKLSKFGLDVIPSADLDCYDIRLGKDLSRPELIIPWFAHTNVLGCGKRARHKLIGLKKITSENEGVYKSLRLPTESFNCLLGMSHVPAGTQRIVLTMNEFDAIAINSASSKYKAVSLPRGITHLPVEVLPYLETFSEIILWFDDRPISWEAAWQFTKKLGSNRYSYCSILLF